MGAATALLGGRGRGTSATTWKHAVLLIVAASGLVLIAWRTQFGSAGKEGNQLLEVRREGETHHQRVKDDPLSASTFARVASKAERAFEKSLVQSLRAEAQQGMGKIVDNANDSKGMPTLKQIREERRFLRIQRRKAEGRPVVRETVGQSKINDCGGRTLNECSLALDGMWLKKLESQHPFGAKTLPQTLLEVSQAPRPVAGHSFQTAKFQAHDRASDVHDRIRKLEKMNAEEEQLHRLLQQNEHLHESNMQLAKANGLRVKRDGRQLRVLVDESTQGNPPGVEEEVPATVTAAPQGPADFNGATGVIAKLPGLGFGNSVLNEEGVEQRGSFVIRKANPYAGIVYRVYGKMNHHISCTLKGYRKLDGAFLGNTVFTGYSQTWSGKSSFTTGYVPAGGGDEFDMITCRDKETGEVQHFRDFPDAPDSSFDHEYPLA